MTTYSKATTCCFVFFVQENLTLALFYVMWFTNKLQTSVAIVLMWPFLLPRPHFWITGRSGKIRQDMRGGVRQLQR